MVLGLVPEQNGAKHLPPRLAAIALIVSSTLLLSCGIDPVGSGGSASSGFTYRQSFPWPVSTPQAQGMDPSRVAQAMRQIENDPYIHCFLVIRNDSLVLEYYAPGYVPENDFPVSSVSISILSALTGLAMDQGLISSPVQKILKYFPEFDTTNIDPRKPSWTIEQFLTMRSGIDWNEEEDHSGLFNSHSNWLTTALGLPMRYAPGDTFIVASPVANILAALLGRAAGVTTYRFAETNLFAPLRISVRSWATDPQDVYLGATGMRFTARDLARFGQIYLHNGALDGKQILSRDWIRQSLIPRNPRNANKGDLPSVNFGYLWWTNYDNRDSLYLASGFGGQTILVDPSQKMIIVVLADADVAPAQGDDNARSILALIKMFFL